MADSLCGNYSENVPLGGDSKANPNKLHQPPPLPVHRLREAPPFKVTGIEYLGHLFVRARGKSKKSWIFPYTCCVIRAVHLDVVTD